MFTFPPKTTVTEASTLAAEWQPMKSNQSVLLGDFNETFHLNGEGTHP